METINSTIQAIKNTVAENFGGPAHSLAEKRYQFSLEQVPDLSGKVAVVTGGSEGIGFGCTHTLLSKNIEKLFIITRREQKGEEAVKSIEEEFGPAVAKKVVVKTCDLSDFTETAKTADAIASETEKIHILINNAGRGIMTRQLAPANGIDLHMAVNTMGHIVFTSHLLQTLKSTADKGETVRIVNLGSNAHQNAPKDVKFASVEELNQDFGPMAQYGRSKLGTMLHAKWLASHLRFSHPNILVNTSHPGVVDTNQTNEYIHEPYPILGYGVSALLKPFRKDQFMGCVSTMYCATAATESGQYITPPAIPEEGDPKASNIGLADNLMKLTAEIVEQKTRSESSAKGCPFKMD